MDLLSEAAITKHKQPWQTSAVQFECALHITISLLRPNGTRILSVNALSCQGGRRRGRKAIFSIDRASVIMQGEGSAAYPTVVPSFPVLINQPSNLQTFMIFLCKTMVESYNIQIFKLS
jgi:hypothetical protein